MNACKGINKAGGQCGARPRAGSDRCSWHSIARIDHIALSSKGGVAKATSKFLAEQSVLAELYPTLLQLAPELDTLDLTTPQGNKAYLAASLRALARLPFTTKEANSVAVVGAALRAAIEQADIAERLDRFEAEERGELNDADELP